MVPVFKQWGAKTKNINNIEYSILQTTTGSNTNLPQEIITKSRPVSELENVNEGIVSIKLPPIDKAKKYKR